MMVTWPASPHDNRRILLREMADLFDPVPPGTHGTILGVVRCSYTHTDEYGVIRRVYDGLQFDIDWDINRSLGVMYPLDKFDIYTVTEGAVTIDPKPPCFVDDCDEPSSTEVTITTYAAENPDTILFENTRRYCANHFWLHKDYVDASLGQVETTAEADDDFDETMFEDIPDY